MKKIAKLRKDLNQERDGTENAAKIKAEIRRLFKEMKDSAFQLFLSAEKRLIVSTAFKAISFLRLDEVSRMTASGFAPFTTVVIDEASLVSRATTAALSLLGARRIILVGDPKQLAPILSELPP